VDTTADVAIGVSHDIAVCLTSAMAPTQPTVTPPPDPNANGVAGFSLDVIYDAELNSCVDKNCNRARPCTQDDMPDLNEGTTLGQGVPTSPDVGGGLDCSITGYTEPSCTGGVAHIECICIGLYGPYPPTGPGIAFPIFVVTFTADAVGVDNLALANVIIIDRNYVLGSCNPVYPYGPEMPCFGATVNVLEATPTPTPTATPTPDTGSGQVTISEGGEVTSDDEENGVSPSDPIDTTVSALAGSASNDTTITITETSASDPSVPPAPSDLRVLGQVAVIETSPEATFSPENPATLTITYDDSVVSGNESTIEVRRFDGSEWVPLGEPCTGGVVDTPLDPDPCISARDTDANSITIKTTSLSDWALMGPLAPIGVGGMQQLPDIAGKAGSSGGSSWPVYAIAGAAAVGAITAGAWYARRRRAS